jgi:hypothetical protein
MAGFTNLNNEKLRLSLPYFLFPGHQTQHTVCFRVHGLSSKSSSAHNGSQ